MTMLVIPHDDIRRGLENCLSGKCNPSCPYYGISDRRRCREALLDNAIDYLSEAEKAFRELNDLIDECIDLRDVLEKLEDKIDG